MEHKFSFVK